MKLRGISLLLVLVLIVSAAAVTGCGKSSTQPPPPQEKKDPIVIGRIDTFSGVLEYYGKEGDKGFLLGLEYATGGTMEVNGRKIQVVSEDTETNPEIAKQKALKLLDKDKVNLLVGSTSSADTLAIMPLAEEFKTPLVVAAAIADSITGAAHNRYTFRTARNNSQDAVTWAAAIGRPGVKIAILAEDYAMGRDGVAAFKANVVPLGAEIVYEQYAPSNAADFTPYMQAIIASKPDYAVPFWAGANTPWFQMAENLPPVGIKMSMAMLDLPHLKLYKDYTAAIADAFCIYYYEIPNNAVNDWFVKAYKERYNSPPTYSTEAGFSAAIAVVEALKKTGGDTDAEKLISAMEGMSFETPKGTKIVRKEDHQTLQEMYVIDLQVKDGYDWAVPVLKKVLTKEQTAPPLKK